MKDVAIKRTIQSLAALRKWGVSLKPEELQYENLKSVINSFEDKGREEARSFLNWFLENIFRLDPIEADDCICDKPNDRGIDAIYVDDNQNEILVLQGKIKQRESSIGDGPLRELAGTITQIETVEAVDALIAGGGNEDLKNLLLRLKIRDLVSNGYSVIGSFVSNQPLDENGREFAVQHGRIRVYDRNRISSEYIDIEADGGVDDTFSFDLSYVEPLQIKTKSGVSSYVLPVQARELVRMSGIDDGTLFSQNVRQSLGNTKVNKAMKESVADKGQHQFFPLYHNGVTILCKRAEIFGSKLNISQYVVVNGAQSISTFKKAENSLSDDLRVIAKIIELDDSNLAKAITINSNNQNAIKPRDLKSTNEVQIRLKHEFEEQFLNRFEYEIKRGQTTSEGVEVITNEEAGRLLLAFDLLEPESCHQVYKLFDDKYTEIFARPAVTAARIVFLSELMKIISNNMPHIEYRPLSKYGLTRFFLLSVLSEMFKKDADINSYIRNPQKLLGEKFENFGSAVSDALRSMIIDLNYEVKQRGDAFDYKGDLKSPAKIRELREELLKSYEKEIAKGKIKPVSQMIAQ
ncbi:AIPR family protein [Agrobacterium larrymoorei]|uniref:AIPR family protein n=1 Tax=Agrobacterium larrymoorei TaxID=160699 RepID=UPI00191E11E9|nr:AIPR family protein [Agrobacterium larrymoorei]